MYQKGNHQKLRVEPLQAKHLPMLGLSKQLKSIWWVQIMLLKTWLAEAEGKLQGIIPMRQPRCLVALENNDLIAIIVLQPANKRGSCWGISLPEFIKEPLINSRISITKILLKEALRLDNNLSKSWVIKSYSYDSTTLSLLRELGFQPLKIIKCWTYKLPTNKIKNIKSYPNKVYWEKLSRTNAKLLFQLQKSCESAHLREILDIQRIDLLEKNHSYNGVLISQRNSLEIPILGLITPICSENQYTLEIIRDIAWDSRVEDSLSKILDELLILEPRLSIESSSDDDKLNKQLENLNWTENYDLIVLGKSLWKRKLNNKFITDDSSLKSIFSGLKPNQPPLPTPTLQND